MTRTMAQLAEDLRVLAEEFTRNVHEAAGRDPSRLDSGDVQAAALAAGPGEVIVVWLPPHSEPHLAADLLRFIDAQREATGITIPVLVTLASDVTTGPGG